MSHNIDLAGQQIGWLLVDRISHRSSNRSIYWRCVCKCQKIVTVRTSALIAGKAQSCGCYKKEVLKTHGHTINGKVTPEYTVWANMIQRCYNPMHEHWKHYGARGIKVCQRWRRFENFYEDMGKRPANLTLERKRNNEGYSKDNCKWATRKEQANNQRRSRCNVA